MSDAMTECEWMNSRLVEPMRNFLSSTPGLIYKGRVQQHHLGRRKLRLFGVAVSRRVLHLVSNPVLHQLLEAAEAFADGSGTLTELERLRLQSGESGWMGISESDDASRCRYLLTRRTREQYAAQAVTIRASRDAISAAFLHENAAIALEGENMLVEVARQADLFRDIFGNPFRQVAFDPAWRTDTAVALARQMYDSRDFGAMPILADALQDAGCEDAAILGHCRDTTQPHVRGCWVVDLVLGKA